MSLPSTIAVNSNRRFSMPVTQLEKDIAKPASSPIEKFNYSDDNFHFSLPVDSCAIGLDGSTFDKTLLQRWDEAKHQGALLYELNLLYKTLPGRYGLSAQLNMERASCRRKPQSFRELNVPFDSRRFNFNKIQSAEVLFELCRPNRQQQQNEADATADSEIATAGGIPRHVVIVNNSPIEKGHSLLVPFIDQCLPQKITCESFTVAVEAMLLSSCKMFFLVYNSLLAHASVNHLHFHLYYWPYVSNIVTWPVERVVGDLYSLRTWIIPGFALQLKNGNVEAFVKKVVALSEYFRENRVPHNLFMARAPNLELLIPKGETAESKAVAEGAEESRMASAELVRLGSSLFVTAYVFPRKPAFGSKPTSNFNPAACECAGHLLIYTSTFFQSIHESRIVHIMRDEAFLEGDKFEQLLRGLEMRADAFSD